MLDIKRVLKAAPTKMRSREPLRQLWTPWGERIEHEWLSARAGNKAFTPSEEGERKLAEGRTPILDEHPRPDMVRGNHTMLNGLWDYAIVSIPEDENASKRRKTAAMLTRDEAVRAVREAAIPQTFDGKILVPFSPESALSGVHQTIYPDNLMWYRTVVHPVTLGDEEAVRQIGDANRLILHFEAVDYICACYINGQLAGIITKQRVDDGHYLLPDGPRPQTHANKLQILGRVMPRLERSLRPRRERLPRRQGRPRPRPGLRHPGPRRARPARRRPQASRHPAS